MKKLIQPIFLFFFCFQFNLASSQYVGSGFPDLEYPTALIDTNMNIVISPNGLSIREHPTLKSKRLTVVPFGKKVNILSTKNYGWDSIGVYKNIVGNLKKDFPIRGQWVKVKYKNWEGFMLNVYLMKSVEKLGKIFNCNKDFALQFPGIDCKNHVIHHPDINWYGVYLKNGKLTMQKTTISYFRTFMAMTDYGISTGENKNLAFIIGSKKELNQKHLNGKYFQGFGSKNKNYLIKESNKKNLNDIGLRFESNGSYKIHLFAKRNGIEQELNPTGLGHKFSIRIIWAGDLDDDGNRDYIINYGDKSAHTILYLSSQAEEGKIVKPVAIYFSAYCC